MSTRLLLPVIAVCLIVGIGVVGCSDSDTMTVDEEVDAIIEEKTNAGLTPVDKADPPKNGEVLKLSFSGENPAYHTGLLNQTSFILDAEADAAAAHSERPFEEPFGEQTLKGTDSVFLTGDYDAAAGTISEGELTIEMRGTSSGGDTPNSTIVYTMEGSFTGNLDGDVWRGTVTGTSTLTQTWEGEGGAPPVNESKNVSWTWESVSRNVIE